MKKLVRDELWSVIAPLLPKREAQPTGGRPRADERAALTGIVFVLKMGIPWQDLPTEAFGCSGSTSAGVGSSRGTKRKCGHACTRCRSRCSSMRARSMGAARHSMRGACRQKECAYVGPNPTDRAKPGSKHHVLVDRNGLALMLAVSAANVHDSKLLAPMLDAVICVRSGRRSGRPRRQPGKLHADKAYDHRRRRRECREPAAVIARIARKGIDSSERLGRYRWVAERTIAWRSSCKRLLVRFERRGEVHLELLTLAGNWLLFRALHGL